MSETHGIPTIEQLADSFVAQLRQGASPSIEQYEHRYPQLADEIRAVFSTLVMLEQGGQEFDRPAGDRAAQQAASPAGNLESLGEYRILREIGRGGMGIVYEAEHGTMRRRVALKILPVPLTPGDRRLRRFYQEARLAGRLHHTNIVPVFEIGTDRGYHYYSMQYIEGQSLDIVIRELRHLDSATSSKVPGAGSHGGSSSSLHNLSGSAADSQTLAAVSANDYFRRVAEIGLQLAEALQYAHLHGVLHRDIKPSNVILDARGVAWITDFGLAKQEHALTASGDVVGTLRYMAPERFAGQTDALGDLYGLGLTLYELCTLREAFPGTDRAQLIRDICDSDPIRPRKINPQVPRDLETIVLKAIEKSPPRRYGAAADVAEDLRLFLQDRPIRAHRVSSAERMWRWCRRNPQQALLASWVLVLIVVITVGSLAFGWSTSRYAEQLSESRQQANERLYLSLRRSAEAAQWSQRPGQSTASLQDIANAAEVLPQLGWPAERVAEETVELRNAAIAAIVSPDVHLAASWTVAEPWTVTVAFNPSHSSYAQANQTGLILIRSVDTNQELHRLAPPPEASAVLQMWFSPQGAHLAAEYQTSQGRRIGLWTLASGKLVLMESPPLASTAAFAFHPDGEQMVLANRATLGVFQLSSGEQSEQLQLAGEAQRIAFEPSGARLAVVLVDRRRIELWDCRRWQSIGEVETSPAVSAVAWHPHENRLMVGLTDGSLQIQDLAEGSQSSSRLQRHDGRVTHLEFAPDGLHLLSEAWDGTVRLWNMDTREELLRLEGISIANGGFSQPDGKYFGSYDGSQVQLWKVAVHTPLQLLRSPVTNYQRWSVDIDRSGRWLLSARDNGVELWEIESGDRIDFLPFPPAVNGNAKDARFLNDAQSVLISNDEGLHVVPLRENDEGKLQLQADSARRLRRTPTGWVGIDHAGTRVALRENIHSGMAIVLDLPDPTDEVRIGPHAGLDHVELSPDGRWVATSCWGGSGIQVWNADTGERWNEHLLEPYAFKTNAVFSPDSRWLSAATPKYWVTWRLSDGKAVYRSRRPIHDDWPGPLTYSPDGRYLVVAHSRFQLSLLDAHTGRSVALLNVKSKFGFHHCRFSPDGKVLAAASDMNIYVWKLQRLRERLESIGLDW